jgi:hypothetical protein
MTGRGAGLADTNGLVGELIRLEYKFKRITAPPVVSGARRLGAEVATVLESPSIVGTEARRDYADIS